MTTGAEAEIDCSGLHGLAARQARSCHQGRFGSTGPVASRLASEGDCSQSDGATGWRTWSACQRAQVVDSRGIGGLRSTSKALWGKRCRLRRVSTAMRHVKQVPEDKRPGDQSGAEISQKRCYGSDSSVTLKCCKVYRAGAGAGTISAEPGAARESSHFPWL